MIGLTIGSCARRIRFRCLESRTEVQRPFPPADGCHALELAARSMYTGRSLDSRSNPEHGVKVPRQLALDQFLKLGTLVLHRCIGLVLRAFSSALRRGATATQDPGNRDEQNGDYESPHGCNRPSAISTMRSNSASSSGRSCRSLPTC